MEICFCLFPQFETVLHRIVDKEGLIIKIFERADIKIPELKVNGFELPFFYDFKGKTPIHHAIDSSNSKAMSIMLENIGNYSVDHHDRMICDALPAIVEMELPNLSEYLEARV